VDDDELVAAIEDRTARGIAAAVGRLIRSGALASGDRLPTVRSMAGRLGVSPTTVGEAWQALARAGAVASRGRAGTFVRADAARHGPERYRRVTQGPGVYALDLSTGIPDAALLPDVRALLGRALGAGDGGGGDGRAGDGRAGDGGALTTNYLDGTVDPALEPVLVDRWPFAPERLTVVDGCLDALDRVASVVVRFGDRVLVENPTFPPLLDLLGDLGAEVIGVPLDASGPVPDAVARGLALGPVAFFLQPRAHNPTGVSLTPARVAELAALLAAPPARTGAPPIVVVEDDHAGDVSSSPLVSLGRHLPERTVHISGFSKSHGPDLRLAAVGGAGRVVDAVISHRRLGPGWSSRILQRLLAAMLTDPATVTSVDRARAAYAARRRALAAALADRGIACTGGDGIYLWVPVRDEQAALVSLASHGIGASPGGPFEVAPLDGDHVRLTAGLVPVAPRDGAWSDAVTAAVVGGGGGPAGAAGRGGAGAAGRGGAGRGGAGADRGVAGDVADEGAPLGLLADAVAAAATSPPPLHRRR
jgi:DNA-binding transcriptional MocR family regulator